MTARMSSEFRILYSLPSNLISVPPYLLTSTRSPFLTSNGTFLPLSSVLPVPSATMMLSMGFSFAESGMMMPPFLVSFSSTASTRRRSPRGFTFSAILCLLFVVSVCFGLIEIPPPKRRENCFAAFINPSFQRGDRADRMNGPSRRPINLRQTQNRREIVYTRRTVHPLLGDHVARSAQLFGGN